MDADGKTLDEQTRCPVDRWIGLQLGEAVIGLRPLACDAIGLPDPMVRLVREANYERLEIVNYQGEPRQFKSEELTCMLNGAAIEVGQACDWQNDPVAFVDALEQASNFEDLMLFNTRRMRYDREAMPDRDAVELGLRYSTRTDGLAIRTIHGNYAPQPIWQCTGIHADDLPLMGTGRVRLPLGVPWDDLSVFWLPDSPCVINESGR